MKEKNIPIYRKPKHIFYSIHLLANLVAYLCRKKEHVHINVIGTLPKPPYILIGNHGSFMDYYTAFGVAFPHRAYWPCAIESLIHRPTLMKCGGIIPKRKYINDPKSAKVMMDTLTKKRKVLIIFPEARYSFTGQIERIDSGIASLAKACRVPIVMCFNHGHYLRDPQWSDHHIRKIKPFNCYAKCIINKQYVDELSVDEIQEIILENFTGDEEKYQLDNNVKIDYKKRAEGIERILYKCPHCGKEFNMTSKGSNFKCNSCGKEYTLHENGTISCINGTSKFKKVSDWYYYEKKCVVDEVKKGIYHFEDDARLELLTSLTFGFKKVKGNYHLVHSINNGIQVFDENNKIVYERNPLLHFAIHIEYDFHHKGGCIDLATNDITYFAYPLHKQAALTKIHFANEAIFDYHEEKLKSNG